MGMVIFGPGDTETLEPIHLKSGTFDYVHSPIPHAKYGGRRKWGWGEVVHLRAFYPRDVVSTVYAPATWLTGWLGGLLAVCHSRNCV